MIALVCVFTLFFWHLNRQQKHKGKLIQNMVCLAHEAIDKILCANKSVADRIPLYLLIAISGYIRQGRISTKEDIHSYTYDDDSRSVMNMNVQD